MRSISLLAIRGASFAEATEWAQKGMEIVNDARQSSKGMIECDVAYLLLLYQLGFIHSVSFGFFFFRIEFLFFFY